MSLQKMLLLLLSLHCCKAIAAINRSVACGLERNLCFATAVSASCCKVFSLRSGCVLSCITARLASLGFVLESFRSIKFLLFSCENKLVFAIFTNQCFVFVHLSFPRFEYNNKIRFRW